VAPALRQVPQRILFYFSAKLMIFPFPFCKNLSLVCSAPFVIDEGNQNIGFFYRILISVTDGKFGL
jgi:hypothetical protein